ncbi:MAG: methyltransferase domain-containing protein [Clostridia bacterium]|nr:methyltransferase domain-containing protein [Clostridia bacterium]
MERLEEMSEFFAARLSEYDEHMLSCVEGCREGYIKMAELVPKNAKTLLDLGCGTGLELYEIFKRIPDMEVTGVDLTAAMLQRLREKYPDKKLKLICGDYFTVPFGRDFDCAISFQTMHHFKKDKKAELYKKIYSALADKGVYIECDYMVLTQQEEDLWFAANDRIRKEQGIGDDEFYHYDTPCTIDNQIALFKGAGFKDVKMTFRQENTTMLIARK